MSNTAESTYQMTLVKGGAYKRTFEFYEDVAALTPTNLAGKSPRILVKSGSAQTIEWTVASSQIIVQSGKIQLVLTAQQITDLGFTSASFYLFLDGNDDMVLGGTIRVV